MKEHYFSIFYFRGNIVSWFGGTDKVFDVIEIKLLGLTSLMRV
jgi:hypothetical protein